MYDGHKICNDLKPSERCFVIEQYRDGSFVRIFHEHIPRHRISGDGALGLLKTLVASKSGMGNEQILACYLNNLNGGPKRDRSLDIVISYPEPGVIRKYCGGNTAAWTDEVINKSKFRR